MRRFLGSAALWIVCGILLDYHPACAQGRREPGKPIGTVSTAGDLIVLTLDKDALGKANLFDLAGRTVRFMPDRGGYRATTVPIEWDSEFGNEITGDEVGLHHFEFPFSGKDWHSFSVGITGSLRFGPPQESARGDGDARTGDSAGISIGRFDQLQEAAPRLINTVPAICVFFKPRMTGKRYIKEFADGVLITWDLTEPAGGIQDFTWAPTVNRFQVALHRDGSIDMSYQQIAAKDAIVGVFPIVRSGAEQELTAITAENHAELPVHLDLRNVKLSVLNGLILKVSFETRGPILKQGDPGIAGIVYRISFDSSGADPMRTENRRHDVIWTIRGIGPPAERRGTGMARYFASGPGVFPAVKTDGNTISVEGILPRALQRMDSVAIEAEVQASNVAAAATCKTPRKHVNLSGIRSPEVDLSSAKQGDSPNPVIYESFHYVASPNSRDLACTVIKGLGDKFDFFAYYSDFRIDNQEAGTPSDGPRGGNVTGIGATERGLDAYCSSGRFQWGFVQPVYAGSNQMQEQPPEGITDSSPRNIATYKRQLGERSLDGKMLAYNYAISQIAHEMGHRWTAFVSAKVNGEMIPLGPTHWARGLHAPVVFPYQRPIEASAMGGGVWQDNLDGTFTQLDDDYYVPATGWSYLDLYLMGLVSPAEVPDFFILRNLSPTGKDVNGHPIFKADRTRIRIEDVIAVEGPRVPDVNHSQRRFNTGMVVVVEHGRQPSRELIERTNGIRERWIDYWAITTGGRASMTVNPR